MKNPHLNLIFGALAATAVFCVYGFASSNPEPTLQDELGNRVTRVDDVTFFNGNIVFDTTIPKGNDYPATRSDSTPATMWVWKGGDGKLKLSFLRHGDKGNAHVGAVTVDVKQ